jgi:hypothetical protein
MGADCARTGHRRKIEKRRKDDDPMTNSFASNNPWSRPPRDDRRTAAVAAIERAARALNAIEPDAGSLANAMRERREPLADIGAGRCLDADSPGRVEKADDVLKRVRSAVMSVPFAATNGAVGFRRDQPQPAPAMDEAEFIRLCLSRPSIAAAVLALSKRRR